MVEIMLRINGLIFIFGGIYFLHLVYGDLPENQEEREKREKWRNNYGKIIKILSPILIVGGVLMLLGFI